MVKLPQLLEGYAFSNLKLVCSFNEREAFTVMGIPANSKN